MERNYKAKRGGNFEIEKSAQRRSDDEHKSIEQYTNLNFIMHIPYLFPEREACVTFNKIKTQEVNILLYLHVCLTQTNYLRVQDHDLNCTP